MSELPNNTDKLPEKFSELNQDTIKFLKDLNSEEIKELREAISFFRKASVVSVFFKWLLIGAVGAIITFSTLWDSIITIKGMFLK